MAGLTVYGTQGQCLHPQSGEKNTGFAQYFNTLDFMLDLSNESPPKLDSYLNVIRENGRKEQVFIHYEGTNPDTVFSDCRRAVKRELLEDRGWELPDSPAVNQADSLFMNLIWENQSTPRKVTKGTVFAEYEETVNSLISGEISSTSPLRASLRSYRLVADFIREFAKSKVKISVEASQGAITNNIADIVLTQETQREEISAPPETHRLLNELKEKRKQQRINTQFTAIGDGLRTLRQLEVSREKVQSKIEDALTNSYSNFRLIDESSLSKLQNQAKELERVRRENERLNQKVKNLNREISKLRNQVSSQRTPNRSRSQRESQKKSTQRTTTTATQANRQSRKSKRPQILNLEAIAGFLGVIIFALVLVILMTMIPWGALINMPGGTGGGDLGPLGVSVSTNGDIATVAVDNITVSESAKYSVIISNSRSESEVKHQNISNIEGERLQQKYSLSPGDYEATVVEYINGEVNRNQSKSFTIPEPTSTTTTEANSSN